MEDPGFSTACLQDGNEGVGASDTSGSANRGLSGGGATESVATRALRLLDTSEGGPFELGELTTEHAAPSGLCTSETAFSRGSEVPTQQHLRSPTMSSSVGTSPASLSQFPPPRMSGISQQQSPQQQGESMKVGTTAAAKRHAMPPSPSFSWNEILHVQNLIERCLQQCLSKNEIVATLQSHAKVDPSFTAVVWQKLEEQNPSFFRAYNFQLQLKDQILAFNYLVAKQKEMESKQAPSSLGINFPPASTGTQPNPFVPSSPLPFPFPLPSPIKSDLDTHAFFT